MTSRGRLQIVRALVMLKRRVAKDGCRRTERAIDEASYWAGRDIADLLIAERKIRANGEEATR